MSNKSVMARFWSQVDTSSGLGPAGDCWEWRGALGGSGYGRAWDGHRQVAAHRLAYDLMHLGAELGDRLARHDCDNQLCVRHITPGTHQENMRDMAERRRSQSGDAHWTHRAKEKVARGDRNGARTHPHRRPTGESHGRAKLSAAEVADIRALYRTGKWTQKALGERFGVDRSMVGYIVRGDLWAAA